MSTKLFDAYQTDGSNNPVSLRVSIGNAQTGVSSVTIDGNPVAIIPPAGADGNYRGDFNIILGANAALAGRTMEINTNVQLVMAPTASSVGIELTGGAGPHVYSLQSAAGAAAGSVVNYFSSISFT